MKKILIAAGVAGIALAVWATGFPIANRGDTINQAALSASGTTTTNKVGTGFNVEGVLYHTLIATNGGASQGWVVDRSLDGAAWIVVGTNVLANGAVGEVTMTGKWSYVRVRQIGTNSALNVTYLGGN